MKFVVFKSIVAVLLTLSQAVIAAPVDSVSPSVQAIPSLSVAAQKPVQNDEVVLLRAQLAATHAYHQQFLSVVLWSLGGVIGLAIALAAFNWYSNSVSYRRELEALSRESRGFLAEIKAHLQSEIDSKSSDLVDRLDQRQSQIEEAVMTGSKNEFRKLESKLQGLSKKIIDLEYSDTERRAELALAEGNYCWAITQYAELIKVAIRQGSDSYQATEIIDSIRRILSQHSPILSADDVSQTVEALNQLKGNLIVPAKNLIAVINGHYQSNSR